MSKITSTVWINAPRQKVWRALADFGNVSRLNSGIIDSYLTSDQSEGVGTTRHCDFAQYGASVEERIVAWEEEQLLKIDIYDSDKMPVVKNMKAEFFLSDENGGIKLEMSILYDTSMGMIGKVMDQMMLKPTNLKAWASFAGGIKHFVETGQPIDQSINVDVKPVLTIA